MEKGAVGNGISGKVVLIVDDEAPIRRLVVRLCIRMGIKELLEAENVGQALDLLAKKRVDLVISDLNMPDDSGSKIVHAVRAAHKRTPVLIFSGSLGPGEAKKLKDIGADEVLSKVADLSELENAILKLLHASRESGA